jgi:hypothetical protein
MGAELQGLRLGREASERLPQPRLRLRLCQRQRQGLMRRQGCCKGGLPARTWAQSLRSQHRSYQKNQPPSAAMAEAGCRPGPGRPRPCWVVMRQEIVQARLPKGWANAVATPMG